MKWTLGILLMIIVGFHSGCFGEITGRVVDAEMGLPIEGAIVLVQWTVTKGLPGMQYHEVSKIVETETDREGNFAISGTHNPLANPPEIVIYKVGYVAWRNDYIFPGWEKRSDFKYRNGMVIALKKFQDTFSHEEHHSFMGYGIMGSSFERTPKFSKVLNHELNKALREIEQKKK